MASRLLKIAPREVRAGMYVHALDRPWLETPLRFQGFHVVTGDEPELQWMRRHCAYVLVDADRSDVEEITLQTTHIAPMAPASRPSVVAGNATVRASATSQRPTPSAVSPSRRLWWHRVADRPTRRATQARAERAALSRRVVFAQECCSRAVKLLDPVLARLRARGRLDVDAIEHALTPVVDGVLESTDAMTCVLRMRSWDAAAYAYALETAAWCVVFGKTLGLGRQDLHRLGLGGVLLDVGFPAVADAWLPHAVVPGRPEGSAVLQRHVERGVEMLRRETAIHPRVLQMVAGHHERHDGSGYPRRLAGNEIPLFARIAGLVDTYVTLTTPWPGVPCCTTFEVTRTLTSLSDSLFDAGLVDQFIRMAGVFPTASLVELNTGEVGVVVAQHPRRRLRPQVLVVGDKDGARCAQPFIHDLAKLPSDASEAGSVWVLRVLEPAEHAFDPRDYLS